MPRPATAAMKQALRTCAAPSCTLLVTVEATAKYVAPNAAPTRMSRRSGNRVESQPKPSISGISTAAQKPRIRPTFRTSPSRSRVTNSDIACTPSAPEDCSSTKPTTASQTADRDASESGRLGVMGADWSVGSASGAVASSGRWPTSRRKHAATTAATAYIAADDPYTSRKPPAA